MAPMNARLLRPTASGFSPRRIASLALWLDASADSSLTLNGSTVSEWRDLSGNARHFLQATAAQQPNATARTQNGRRVLDYEAGQVLAGNAAALNVARNIGQMTAIVAAKLDTVNNAPPAGGNRVIFVASIGTGIGGRFFFAVPTGTVGVSRSFTVGGRRLDADSFASLAAPQDTAGTNPAVVSGIISYSNATGLIRQNGTQVASGSLLTSDNTSDTDSQAVGIGASANSDGSVNSNQLDGWIGEVIVYQRQLTTSELSALERYLGAKWGITVA